MSVTESGADLHCNASYLPDTNRLLPQSVDSERGLLSSFLLSPKQMGGFCAEKGIMPERFHLPAHAEIFSVLMKLWQDDKPIDFIILTEAMREVGRLDYVGGPAFITELFTFLPTAANASYYEEITKEKHTLREIIRICTEYAARSYEDTAERQRATVVARLGIGAGHDAIGREKAAHLQASIVRKDRPDR